MNKYTDKNNEKPTGLDGELADVARIKRRDLEGTLLNNRYLIGKLIGTGSFGRVYKAYDQKNKKLPLAVKFSADYMVLCQEIKIIKRIAKHVANNTEENSPLRSQIPNVHAKGLVVLTDDGV